MPFHNPISDHERGGRNQSSGLKSLVQAEKLVQIAFLLPCAMVIGWGAGWWVEHHLGLHGAMIGGLVFGLIAGMVSVIRMALGAGNSPKDRGTK
jgi:ATP synthase protein I